MPYKGKHRGKSRHRKTAENVTKSAAIMGFAAAVPVVGLSGPAHAATVDNSGHFAQIARAEQAKTTTGYAARQLAESGTYVIVSGDTLSTIAAAHNVNGGWRALWKINRATVGDNPNLIFPNDTLRLSGPAVHSKAGDKGDKSARHRSANKPAAQKSESKKSRKSESKSDSQKSSNQNSSSQKSSSQSSSQTKSGSWVLPVQSYHLTARFGQSGNNWGSTHHGLDFAAPTGTPIRAVGDGQIISADQGGAYGNHIQVRHSDGTVTLYGHMSRFAKTSGSVKAGTVIGYVGATGNVTGPHLHLEVRPHGGGLSDAIDPFAWLKGKGLNP
ncbi:M23 family metallopeptidase [Actinopolymorpha alba]|uniref:M23 family metallopeptidase n=1 Tax=Actinopolymorpha alba TaxID=533267 RepID=UPI0003812794|nr:peptidoglycan DD-metalloendopeptidase family protein [Actinopolymorpha alba]